MSAQMALKRDEESMAPGAAFSLSPSFMVLGSKDMRNGSHEEVRRDVLDGNNNVETTSDGSPVETTSPQGTLVHHCYVTLLLAGHLQFGFNMSTVSVEPLFGQIDFHKILVGFGEI